MFIVKNPRNLLSFVKESNTGTQKDRFGEV